MKPFSTYPEDRDTLMGLANVIQSSNDQEDIDKAANKLSDLVLAILSDEAVYEFDFASDEISMIDAAGERHKAAGVNAPTAGTQALPVDILSKESNDSRFMKMGIHLYKKALEWGWEDDGEGAFEYIQRMSYAQGLEDGKNSQLAQEDLSGS